MLDLRSVFDRNRVSWRDRGPNCSKGNVNICCPFCINDPSYHLAVSEEGFGYFCWRNPRHAGRSLRYLFRALHIEVEGFDPKQLEAREPEIRKRPDDDFKLFNHFQAASTSSFAIEYLRGRGFSFAQQVCDEFGLKVDRFGAWAQRLIIPLTQGWTARAMKFGLQPRYKSETDETGFYLFDDSNRTSLLIFEGPLDAIRAASMSKQFAVVGTLGKRMSPSFLHYVRFRRFLSIYVVPDNDVPSHEYFYYQRSLGSYCPHAAVELLFVPKHAKDLCEMGEEEILQWITRVGGSSLNRGLGLGLSGPATT